MNSNTPEISGSKRPSQVINSLKEFSGILVALALALLFIQFAFQSYRVYGNSMEPTLSEGNWLIISKLGATWANAKDEDYLPKRGEIVVLKSPVSRMLLIKRVIAFPGERVVVREGAVTVFNTEHPEGFDPYETLGLPKRFTDGTVITTVPEHHVFVIGDNRTSGGSSDSRNDLGPIPTDKLVGKLTLRIWPFDTNVN